MSYKPNRWSCLPTAFCMIEGLDPTEFISQLGHDGGKILFPELPEPLCRQGFGPDEILDLLYTYDKHYREIQYKPLQQYANGTIRCYVTEPKQRMDKYIKENFGVITGALNGKGHAYANKRGYIFDPDTGMQCSLPEGFMIESFFMRV